MSYVDFFEELERLDGTKARTEFMKTADDSSFELMNLALSPDIRFHVVKFDNEIPKGNNPDDIQLKNFLDLADALSSRSVTGHEAIFAIHLFLRGCNARQYKVFVSVLLKKFIDGIGYTMLKNAFPDRVRPFKLMKPSASEIAKELEAGLPSNLIFPIWVDEKLDGYRVQITLWDMKCYSTSGKLYRNFTVITDALEASVKPDMRDFVMDCEVIYTGEATDGFNGIQRAAFAKHKEKESNLCAMVFDVLTREEWTNRTCDANRKTRKNRFHSLFVSPTSMPNEISWINGKLVNSDAELFDFYSEVLAKGGEGLVVKSGARYEWKRSKQWLKLKAIDTVDAKVIDVIHGTGKHEGKMGALVFEYNGKQCRCGTGFSDQEREQFSSDYIVGKVIEVEFHKDTNLGSTRHARFKRLRLDKE